MSTNDKIKVKLAEIKEKPVKFESTAKKKKAQKHDEIYHLLNSENKKKKISIKTKLLVTFELSFLILTFILLFRKAMKLLLQNNKKEVEDIPTTPKKRQIFKSSSDISNICMCTFVKNQNIYITEFIQFYQKIGVNKFFIYDNNDENGEKVDLALFKEYTDNNKIEIINWRDKKDEKEKMMNDCYKNNYNNYDWLIFYSIDEYLHLKDNIDIKTFLSNQNFEKCESIYLNWLYHTDNNLILYDNRTLQERFPITESNPKNNSYINHYVKPIMKGHLNLIEINNLYKLTDNLKGCDGNGNSVILNGNEIIEKDFENNYIDYYWCKSTEEFVKKINNECNNNEEKNETIYKYFSINEINEEKIKYIEENAKLNLTIFKTLLTEEKKDI